MRKQFVGLIAAVTVTAALVIGGVATAEEPVTNDPAGLHAEFNGGFTPKMLSKTKSTPISFWITGKLEAVASEWVPPLKSLLLEGDKNVSIDVEGLPVCKSGIRSQRLSTAAARKICGKALVGNGKMEIGMLFPGGPIPLESELLAFNGGFRGGVTTIYLHAYITVPAPTAILTVVKVKRVNKGRFGLYSMARIPKIAGGSGLITYFKLKLKKGVLSAKCPDGHLDVRGSAVLAQTPRIKLNGKTTRSCIGKD